MDDLSRLERNLVEQVAPWDRFHGWAHGICVVTFDLELGQAIESVHPPHVALGETDRTNICYLAFPDSNSGVMGDSQFHFRIRLNQSADQTPRTAHLSKKSSVHKEFNRRCPNALQFDQDYLFGFAYFRQVKDASIRRGYYQKSVILLSKLPLITLFNQTVSVIARKFFDGGEVALEASCGDLDRWPLPMPGHALELPLMGNVFQIHLPSLSTRSVESAGETVSLSPDHGDLLPSYDEVDLFTCLLPVVDHLDLLWELVLTAEPMVVMASTPAICSSAVQFLTTIIYPFSYAADYRPFYTIHDSDFKEITAGGLASAPNAAPAASNSGNSSSSSSNNGSSNGGASSSPLLPNIMLGVTNPFFSKALSHWPHIVKLGDQGGNALQGERSPRSKGAAGGAKKAKVSKFKMDCRPGVFSTSKPLLEKDKAVIKRILKGVQLKRPAEVQSALIRRHYLELTQTFMIPLERHIAGLMPLARNISPYRAVPDVKTFSIDDFIASLESGGPQLTSSVKGDWEGLYRRFHRSPNFVSWYNQRHREMSQKLQLLHLESLSEAKIEIWDEIQMLSAANLVFATLSTCTVQ